jgi:aspartate kinase
MIVMKFGGSSVANRGQIEKVMEIVRGKLDQNPVVVSSAHKGITDALINSAKAAVKRDFKLPDVVDLQSEIADQCGVSMEMLQEFYQEINDLLRGIGLVRELSPRSLDYISSFGERMSVRVIADLFNRNGIKAQAFDVWDLGFITNSQFNQARPVEGYMQMMQKAFKEKVPSDVVPVVTGFVGKTQNGDITTLGRNGSDLTASLMAAALGADEVEIWTDTDGVMTADPSVVDRAKNIPVMSFDEAAELAYFGSKVLHPSTLLPAMKSHIPVRVLNTNRPEHPGTVINQDGDPKAFGVTSVAYKENQVVCSITSTGMFGQAGFLAKVFEVLARHKVVVDVISTSEISVSFTTDRLEPVQKSQAELEQYGHCKLSPGKTVLVVVGRLLAERKGVAARVLKALAEVDVPVDMLSFGQDSMNFSLVVDDNDIDKAVTRLHGELFEHN